MKTKIEKEFELEEPIEKVWKYMSNPSEIVAFVPGAELTEKVDDANYKGTVTAKFGPVKSSYKGDIAIKELDQTAYRMVLQGKGKDAKGKGSATMNMEGTLEVKDGLTHVRYAMEISLTGQIAQFGSRLIKDVSDQLLNQFIGNFKAALADDTSYEPAKAQSVNAFAILWTVIKGFFRRLFGSKEQTT